MSIAKINSLRAAIADKKAERASVESSRVSHDELSDTLETQITRASEAVRAVAYRIGTASYEDGLLLARVDLKGRADVLPAMVVLFGADVVRENLARFVKQVPNGATRAERDSQIATIDAGVEKLERTEEAAIRALEAQGVEVIRRADASPAAVLAGL